MSRFRCAGVGLGVLSLTGSLLIVLPGAASAEEVAEGAADFSSQSIARGDDGVFPNYRIPAIIQLSNGDLLASYDGRPTGWDAPGPNSILQRRSTDNGRTWGEQTVVAAGRDGEDKIGYSDPSYVYDSETDTLFNFHVFSKDTGFWNSVDGDDDDDRDVMSASVSVSTDGGVTWAKHSVTEIVKPAGVRATFASSGHGIQIRNGAHAGRLVLQYAGAMVDGTVQAYSVYSDDHGRTWTMGAPTGTNMDENKVVELSDGTLMLNSRMHTGGTWRYVATSTDGGATWSEPVIDHTLTDPRNNASIIRKNPEAEPGTREARELLFSNANSTSGRLNGSVRYSCDDGATWPVVRSYEAGETQYSDLVAKADGTFGVLYEAVDNNIRYGEFSDEWLTPFCASFSPATASLGAGASTAVSVTVRNDDAVTLPAGTAALELPAGWTAGTVETPALAPGESADLTIAATAPASVASSVVRGDVVVHAGKIRIRGDVELTINDVAPAHLGITVTSALGEHRDIAVDPYEEGDRIPVTFRVESTANVPQTVTPLQGNVAPFLPPESGNCRWRGLPAGDAYTCATPHYTVTADDIANGYFQIDTVWELTADGMEPVRVEHRGDRIPIRGEDPNAPSDPVAGSWVLLSDANTSVPDVDFRVPAEGEVFVGDWDGDGTDTLAWRVGNRFTFTSSNTDGGGELTGMWFGKPEDEVFVGDWDGDGIDTIGVRRGNVFHLRDDFAGGNASSTYAYGREGDEVVVGDFDGNGTDTPSVRRGNAFHIRNSLDGGDADRVVFYGKPGERVLVGDVNGDGLDELVVRRADTFHLRYSLTSGNAERVVRFGGEQDVPLVGDWNGDGTDSIGVLVR